MGAHRLPCSAQRSVGIAKGRILPSGCNAEKGGGKSKTQAPLPNAAQDINRASNTRIVAKGNEAIPAAHTALGNGLLLGVGGSEAKK